MPKAITYEEISERLMKVNPSLIIIKETYKNKSHKCKFTDQEGREFWAYPFNVLNGKTLGHPDSTSKRRMATFQEKYGVGHISQLDSIKAKKSETCLKNYGTNNPSKSSTIKKKKASTCLKNFGEENPSKVSSIQEKKIQTLIANGFHSKGEQEVKDFIESLGFFPVKSHIGGSRPMEIDLLIKEKNLAIEYNGEYWHSEETGRDKNYHLSKTEACLKKGNSLIHIFESEWIRSPERMKNILKGRLDVFDRTEISEHCNIKEISTEESLSFLGEYALGDESQPFIKFGMFLNEELLLAATVSETGGNPQVKFTHKPGTRIVGALKDMSLHIYGAIGEFEVIVDRTKSEGENYLDAGYKLIKTFKPDFYYYDPKTKEVRSKSSLKVGSANGLTKVWDCGKHKFIFKNTSKKP